MAKQILNPVRGSKNQKEAQKDNISNGVKKTYKFRLYPTKSQKEILNNHLSLCRWLYNYFLKERRTLYEKNKTKIYCFDQIKEIPKLKLHVKKGGSR